MSILADHEIRSLALDFGMISPFSEKLVSNSSDGKKFLSFGLSSYGYDARIAPSFKIFQNVQNQIIDPKNFSSELCISSSDDYCIIPPNGFCLTHTVEYFKIPKDILVICLGKSTYARCGVVINVTPLEPEWEGQVTLEFSNTTSSPVKIYANEGGCQFIFLKANNACEQSYSDRKGKYSNQQGIVLPKV